MLRRLPTLAGASALGLCFVLVFAGRDIRGFSSGAPSGTSGAPGESSCVICHFGFPPNSGTARFEIEAPEFVASSNAFPVRVSFGNTSSPRHGFEISLQDSERRNAGTWRITEPQATRLADPRHVTHTFGGVQRQAWNMEWLPPVAAPAPGPLQLFAAGNQANGNGSQTGDRVYVSSRKVYQAGITSPNAEWLLGSTQALDLVAPRRALHEYEIVLSDSTTPTQLGGPFELPVDATSPLALLPSSEPQNFLRFRGTLDAAGAAQAQVILPPISPLVNRTLHLAFFTRDRGTGNVSEVSSRVSVQVVRVEPRVFSLSELLLDPTGTAFPAPVLEIRNRSELPQRISGVIVRHAGGNAPLPSVELAGNGLLRVHFGRSGTNGASDAFLPALAAPSRERGSVALFAPLTTSFEDPGALLDFVQWGSGGELGEDVAVRAGEWQRGDYAAAAPPGEALAWDDLGNFSSDWFARPETLGRPNARAFHFAEVLVEPAPHGLATPELEMVNLAPDERSTAGFLLDLHGAQAALPATTIAPRARVRIHLGPGTSTPTDLFVDGLGTALAPTDAVALYLPGTIDFGDAARIEAYVAWGAAGSAREATAVAAGLWHSGEAIEAPGDRAIAWDGSGSFAADYVLEPAPTLGRPNFATLEDRTTFFGGISGDRDVDRFVFDAGLGDRVDLSVRALRSGTADLVLRVIGPDELEIDLGRALRHRSNGAAIDDLALELAGPHRLEISAEPGTTGAYLGRFLLRRAASNLARTRPGLDAPSPLAWQRTPVYFTTAGTLELRLDRSAGEGALRVLGIFDAEGQELEGGVRRGAEDRFAIAGLAIDSPGPYDVRWTTDGAGPSTFDLAWRLRPLPSSRAPRGE